MTPAHCLPIENTTASGSERPGMPAAVGALLGRAHRLLDRWRHDARGVAAVEFAMIVPIMAVMFIGAVELSQAITVDRRVSQTASATADLVARSETQISQTEITDIMRAGSYIVAPYSAAPLRITVRNVTSSPTDATVAKQSWSCTFNGTGNALSCACSNTLYTLPTGLVSTNDSVVISEAVYDYKPLVFDYFMKKGGGATAAGTYTLDETIHLKPRGQAAMLLQADGTPCPSPTFP
jgi:Flp pilus assembly protein TadG